MLDDFRCESGNGRLSSAGSKGSSRNASPSRRGQNLKTQVLNLESDVVKVQELVTESPSKNSFFPPIEPKQMIRPGTAIGGRSTNSFRPSSARPQTASRPKSRELTNSVN